MTVHRILDDREERVKRGREERENYCPLLVERGTVTLDHTPNIRPIDNRLSGWFLLITDYLVGSY